MKKPFIKVSFYLIYFSTLLSSFFEKGQVNFLHGVGCVGWLRRKVHIEDFVLVSSSAG